MFKITTEELKEITKLLDKVSKLKDTNFGFLHVSSNVVDFENNLYNLSLKAEKLSNKIKVNYEVDKIK
jgi:hypothetical protein